MNARKRYYTNVTLVAIDWASFGLVAGHNAPVNWAMQRHNALIHHRSFDDLRLEDHAIVVHGRMVDGEYQAPLPGACGTLSTSN